MTELETKRLEKLKSLIAKYDMQYYEEGVSDISDAEYDRLYDEYLEFEAKYPELKEMADAPTKRVGAGKEAGTTTGLPKFTHKSPLLSIDQKSKDLDSLHAFYQKYKGEGRWFIVEPKLDGITVNVNYEAGKFVNAATRGNGYIGDLITDQFKNTDARYPEELGGNAELEVRGEAIIPFDYFKKHLMEEYSNPRNAVAGIMRQVDPKSVKGKGVQVMFYDIGQSNMSWDDNDFVNVRRLLDYGFQTAPVYRATCWDTLKELVETGLDGAIQQIDGFNVLVQEGYPQAVCDGLVIKVASAKEREEIGMSEKGPRWAFAYKFKPLQATTRINHVEWQVGARSGRITPVAVFDEISLGGTKITKATLNNYDYMQTLPVLDSDGKVGLQMDDEIVVERSNDVIPRIIAIKKHQKILYPEYPDVKEAVAIRKATFDVPQTCPVCGHTLEERYPLHFCTNPLCSAQMKGKMEQYASRDAMNIVGLGEGIIDVLFENHLLTDIPSIYSLHTHQESLLALPKFGKRKVEKLLKSIEDTKQPELWQFIYALSIPGVGKKAAKDLAQRFHTLDNLFQASQSDILAMEDMGDITSSSIISVLHDSSFVEMVDKLLAAGVTPKPVEIVGERFKGMTFVITGTLNHPRKFYQDMIEKNGGKVSGSVSKKTSVVLIGDDAGSKEAKARKLVADGTGIVLLTNEDDIMKYLEA